jgi:serine phosphatase RsbU (regulator of sigma subunit)
VPSQRLGGDFIDVLSTGNAARVSVVIDVSGHGTAAALMGVSISAELGMMLRTRDLTESMTALNCMLCASDSGLYACAAVIETLGERVRIINAGLPPVALIRQGKIVREIMASGTPPGLIAQADYSVSEFSTQPGDRLVMVTDGLTEHFGHADALAPCIEGLRLFDVERHPNKLTPQSLSVEIRSLIESEGRVASDDATLFVMERDQARGAA